MINENADRTCSPPIHQPCIKARRGALHIIYLPAFICNMAGLPDPGRPHASAWQAQSREPAQKKELHAVSKETACSLSVPCICRRPCAWAPLKPHGLSPLPRHIAALGSLLQLCMSYRLPLRHKLDLPHISSNLLRHGSSQEILTSVGNFTFFSCSR